MLLWFVGELIGGIVGYLVMGPEGFGAYIMALVGAAIGAGVAYMIVSGLSAKSGSMLDHNLGAEGYDHADSSQASSMRAPARPRSARASAFRL